MGLNKHALVSEGRPKMKRKKAERASVLPMKGMRKTKRPPSLPWLRVQGCPSTPTAPSSAGEWLPPSNLHFTASFSPHIWDRIHLSLQTAQPSNIADFLTSFSGIIPPRPFSISHAAPPQWISFPVCDLQLLLSDVKAGPPALIGSLFSLLLRTDQLPWANGVIGSSLEFYTSFTSLGIFIDLSVCGPYGSLNHS